MSNHWQATFLGLKEWPRGLSGFAIGAFFTFTASERAVIEARRPTVTFESNDEGTPTPAVT